MTTITPVTLARALAAAFERRTRDNGESFDTLRDGSPEWMTNACRAAHDAGDMLPNDWRYRAISTAAELMGNMDDDEDIEPLHDGFGEPDAYTADRIAWLASHPARAGYCDEARENYGTSPADLIEQIGYGQSWERDQVWRQLATFLTEEAERQTAAAEETADA